MTPAEILRAAKAKIEDPAHWCRGGYAMTAYGAFVGPKDYRACQWCGAGAVRAVTDTSDFASRAAPIYLLRAAAEKLGGSSYTPFEQFNDEADHATVMKAFDIAIELAEASQ